MDSGFILKDDSLSSSNYVSSNKSRISHTSKSREISASPKAPETSSRHASYATKPVKVHKDHKSPIFMSGCKVADGAINIFTIAVMIVVVAVLGLPLAVTLT
uniref:Uncharacterized protein n=1 Tax=Lactuca sativa TaxID=4236 RepID=A0A9R1W386_LACSA|nr:hypothetical protein LSAT_V11C300117220 [Lactuca sativa]